MQCRVIKQCAEQHFNKNVEVTCPNDSRHCVVSADNRLIITCEENRKKYILEITQRKVFLHYIVDGGVICNELSREEQYCKCDRLLLEEGNGAAILVELKGKDVCKAMEQIAKTICLYHDYLNHYSYVFARIVMTKGLSNFRTTSQYRKLDKLIRSLRGNMKFKENNFREKYAELREHN